MDAVLNWLWQGSAVALACVVMLRVLERARANVRYVVCWVALLLIVALPALPPVQPAPPAAALPASPADAMLSLPDAWWTSTLLMLAAWLGWASACTVRFVSAMAALRRARSRSLAFPSDVESALPHWRRARVDGRRATLVLSDSVTTAAVLGWGPPMIAVSPSVVRTLDPAELDRVLIHEWVHVQRRDDLVNVLRTAVRILAGWHPGIWWIDRRLHVEREIACDERTVAITGSPKSYAACLMKLASLRDVARALQAAPAVVTMSGLRARITRIVTPPRSIAPLWARSLAVAIVSTLCAMSVGVSGLKLVEAVALAQPFTSTRMPGIIADALAPPAAPAPSSTASRKPSSRRSTTSSPRAQRPPATEPQPSSAPPPPSSEPAAPLPSNPVTPEEPAPPASDVREHHTTPETPAVDHTPDPRPPDVTAAPPRSPWAAVADGGTAIGRKSKDAGVATAGFFTRVARRVAGSFER